MVRKRHTNFHFPNCRRPATESARIPCSAVFCHFFIAFSAATAYLTASRWIPFLLAHAVISGVFYGVAVYFFMNRVVVSLSDAIKYPFSLQLLVVGVVIHIFCVGLPSALKVRRCSMQ